MPQRIYFMSRFYRRSHVSGSLLYRPGVLSKRQILELMEDKHSVLRDVVRKNVDESSFDLTLSDECYMLEQTIKPKRDEAYWKVIGKSIRIQSKEGVFHLKKGNIYVFRVRENIHLSKIDKLFGSATGKSSLGRLDLLVRLIANEADCYDYVPNEQDGSPLYVEIIPMTFDVIVKEGFPISQLRLFIGEPELCRITQEELEKVYKEDLLRDADGNVTKETGKYLKRLTLNLDPVKELKESPSAFCAKENAPPIDLAQLMIHKRKLNPRVFWEIPPIEKDGSLILKKERFYIMRSRERLYLPGYVSVGCEAVKEELGELRIHYAGFAHPGFGRKRRDDEKGTPLIFEVRGHNFDTRLRPGETLASLEFFRMSESIKVKVDKRVKSGYDNQELKLSNYFKDWQ